MAIGILPLISSVVALVFAVTVLDQFFARRRPYQLVWSLGIFMYCVSTVTEFWTSTWGLSEIPYRLWYLIGAVFVAAYLGMGTLYLLMSRRAAHMIMGILAIASLYAAYTVLAAPVDLGAITTLSGKAMPANVRVLTPFFNTFGTLALVGGAIYSAWVFWRKRILAHRMVANILIAAGAVLPAAGGTTIRFGGSLAAFYLLELVGIIVIFAGFLRTGEVFGLYRFPLVHGFKKVTDRRR